jgi:hypothetical protein
VQERREKQKPPPTSRDFHLLSPLLKKKKIGVYFGASQMWSQILLTIWPLSKSNEFPEAS